MAFGRDLLCAASSRGIHLTPDAAHAMEVHFRLLLRWNRSAKLTSLTGEREILDRHFLEPLEALPYLRPGRLIDVGSGGGFPALPLLVARPDLSGTLLEPAARKRAFLKAVARELELGDRVEVLPERVDRPSDLADLGPFDCLTLRGVAAVEPVLEGAATGLAPDGVVLLFLGKATAAAVQAAPRRRIRVRKVHRLSGRRASFLVVLSR